MDYLLLTTAWGGWCAMHSLLIAPSVTGFMRSRFPGSDRWYRIFYNSFSLITLIPLLYYTMSFESTAVFRWEGIWQVLRFAFLLLAFILFREGAKKYALDYFLGIKQLQTGKNNALLNDKKTFAQTGAFGLIRHPWYAGSLLLVWSVLPDYTAATIIISSILSIYLIAGTFLEERKILVECGESYRLYQKQVSMLFPWKWLVRRLCP